MALNDGGCQHQGWRSDFASNGKLHEFCVGCGAERRVSQPADDGEAARLRNGLRWIRHVAAMNALGGSSGPQQMRALTVLAEKLLHGAELADYASSIGAARGKAQEWASSASVGLATVEDLENGLGAATSAEPVPEPRAQPEEAPQALTAGSERVIVLDGHPN
jgi:hypothetical protein